MGERSLFYNSSFIYELGMKIIPGKYFKEKYNCIAAQLHENETLLEPCCGPAPLPGHLKNENHYSGFDINKKFIRNAKKRGLNVYMGDALHESSYRSSDAVVICDSLHHIGIDFEKKALEFALKYARRKIIICEPHIDNYMSYLPGWLPHRKKLLKWWYNFIERDGANQVDIHDLRGKDQLKDILMDGCGVIPGSCRKELQEVGENFIITYHLN